MLPIANWAAALRESVSRSLPWVTAASCLSACESVENPNSRT